MYKAYAEAEFTKEQKLAFVLRAILINEEIRKFVVLNTSKTFLKLFETLHECEKSQKQFLERRSAWFLKRMQGPQEAYQWETGSKAAVSNKDEHVARVDALASQLDSQARGPEHTTHITVSCKRIRCAGFKLKLKKFYFTKEAVEVLE